MRTTSTIRLDRDALEANLQALRALGDGSHGICAVVKADAYGIGASRVVPRMVAQGVDLLAVFSPSEACEISEFSGQKPILVLMPVHELDRSQASMGLLSHGRLHLVAHDEKQILNLEEEARILGVRIPLHLELDTGMGRGGCLPAEASRVLSIISASSRLELAGLMTHLPDPVGDPDRSRSQRATLTSFLEEHQALVPERCRLHAAATAAAIRDSSLRLDMLRVGIGWAGITDHVLQDQSSEHVGHSFQPILSWWSNCMHIRQLSEGSTVGYGSGWRAPRDSRIGLIPVGYADGYAPPRNGMQHRVMVHGRSGSRLVPVVGSVNMDQIMLDLTDAGSIESGDAVELISNDPSSPIHLTRVAARAGMLPYAFLTGLGHRIPRVLVAGGHGSHSATTSLSFTEARDRQAMGG